MVTDSLAVPPALVAVHVSVVPLASVVMDVASHQVEDVIADWSSVITQDTATSPVCHPLSPSAPTTDDVIVGAVVSVGVTVM